MVSSAIMVHATMVTPQLQMRIGARRLEFNVTAPEYKLHQAGGPSRASSTDYTRMITAGLERFDCHWG
jgi:hypothetical protein